MEKEEKYLPLGSIVLLKGGTKKVMITGYCMKTVERPDKIYDYNGCPFPDGTIQSDLTCVFDHDQIEQIFFKGYVNEESTKFHEKIKEQISDKTQTQQATQKETPTIEPRPQTSNDTIL